MVNNGIIYIETSGQHKIIRQLASQLFKVFKLSGTGIHLTQRFEQNQKRRRTFDFNQEFAELLYPKVEFSFKKKDLK